MEHWRVCQDCGRVIAATAALGDGWLVAPARFAPDVLVIRCYAHITEHAMRTSMTGRTAYWRQKAAEGRARAATESRPHPYIEPFPLEDRP